MSALPANSVSMDEANAKGATMNRTNLIAVSVAALLGAVAAQAADQYPQQQPLPQQQYPQQQYPQQFQQQGAPAHPMRALFAQSLATVAQTSGSAAIVALTDGLTGALQNWFDSKRKRKAANGALGTNYYPQTSGPAPMQSAPANYPSDAPMAPQGYPAPTPDAGQYPAPTDPGAYPPPGTYPTQDSAPPNPDGYNTNTYPTGGDYPTPPGSPPLYAGIAYEIHLLQPNGSTAQVDPATYTFRTGDQFRVFYRPSLPGRVDVFNINAAGQNAQIDSSIIAAGELASLGPYQFTELQGEETLILKLSPCVTQATYVATRNIVKAPTAGVSSMPTNNPLGFDYCNDTSTRGLKARPKTRDIRKVSVEGGTTFALDPIAPTELGGGDMAPRQVTITLHHR